MTRQRSGLKPRSRSHFRGNRIPAHNDRSDNPAAKLKVVLGKVKREPKHYPSLPHARVAEAMRAVWTADADEPVRLLLEFIVLTACRFSEAADLTWTDVDFDSRVWTVPAERMKAGCLHRVPLARQALDLLERTRTLSRSGSLAFVRYGRGRPRRVGDAAVNKLLQRLGLVDDTGCKVTVHGFRSTYRV